MLDSSPRTKFKPLLASSWHGSRSRVMYDFEIVFGMLAVGAAAPCRIAAFSEGKTWPFVLAFGRQNRTMKACSGSVAFFGGGAVLCGRGRSMCRQCRFRARFQAANGAHELEQAEAILNEWKAASPGDPEYYIAAANFVLNHESSVSISTQRGGTGRFRCCR